MNTIIKQGTLTRLLSILLTIVMLAGMIPAFTLTARASGEQTAQDIISYFNNGPLINGVTAAIDDSDASGNTVIITGAWTTGARTAPAFAIPEGVTVVWQADISTSARAVTINGGSGTFKLVDGGKLAAGSNYSSLFVSGTASIDMLFIGGEVMRTSGGNVLDITATGKTNVAVSGGTFAFSGSGTCYYIMARAGTDVDIGISGGNFSTTGTAATIIYADAGNSTVPGSKTNINISSGVMDTGAGNGGGIINIRNSTYNPSATDITITGGEMTTGGHALNVECPDAKIDISGGAITSNGNSVIRITNSADVVVSGGTLTSAGPSGAYVIRQTNTDRNLSGSVVIKGDAKLIATSTTGTSFLGGLQASGYGNWDFRMEGGSIFAESGSASGVYGVDGSTSFYSYVPFTMTGGSITVNTASTASQSVTGISNFAWVLMSGGTITVNAAACQGTIRGVYCSWNSAMPDSVLSGGTIMVNAPAGQKVYGIDTAYGVNMSGATISVNGGSGDVYGINTTGISGGSDSTMSGGRIEARGNGTVHGLYTGSIYGFTMTGGEIYAEGDGAATNGLHCGYNMSMTGGSITAVGENAVGARLQYTSNYDYQARFTGGTVYGDKYGIYSIKGSYSNSTMLVAYLAGVAQSGADGEDALADVANSTNTLRMVEVDSLDIPLTRHGTSEGLTPKDGRPAPVWDLTGDKPVINYGGNLRLIWDGVFTDPGDISAEHFAQIYVDAGIRSATVLGPGEPEAAALGALNREVTINGRLTGNFIVFHNRVLIPTATLGDAREVTLTLWNATCEKTSVTVALDEDLIGSVTIALTWNGGIIGTALAEDPDDAVDVYLFGADDRKVNEASRTVLRSGDDFGFYNLQAGEYTLVYVRSNNGTGNVVLLSALLEWMDAVGVEYATQTASVQSGFLTAVPVIETPHTDVDMLYNPGLTVMFNRRGSTIRAVIMPVSENMRGGVRLRADTTGSAYTLNQIRVNGKSVPVSSGGARFRYFTASLNPSDYGGFPLVVEYEVGPNTFVWEEMLKVYDADNKLTLTLTKSAGSNSAMFDAPNEIGAGTFTVSGMVYTDGAEQAGKVIIYNNGVQVAETDTFDSRNRWNVEITLQNPMPGSKHTLTAVFLDADGNPLPKQPAAETVHYIRGVTSLKELRVGMRKDIYYDGGDGWVHYPDIGGPTLIMDSHYRRTWYDRTPHSDDMVFRAVFTGGAGLYGSPVLVFTESWGESRIPMRYIGGNVYEVIVSGGNYFGFNLGGSGILGARVEYDPIIPEQEALTQNDMNAIQTAADDVLAQWQAELADKPMPDPVTEKAAWLDEANRRLGLGGTGDIILDFTDNSSATKLDITCTMERVVHGVTRRFNYHIVSETLSASAANAKAAQWDALLGGEPTCTDLSDGHWVVTVKTNIPGGAVYTHGDMSDSSTTEILDTTSRVYSVTTVTELPAARTMMTQVSFSATAASSGSGVCCACKINIWAPSVPTIVSVSEGALGLLPTPGPPSLLTGGMALVGMGTTAVSCISDMQNNQNLLNDVNASNVQNKQSLRNQLYAAQAFSSVTSALNAGCQMADFLYSMAGVHPVGWLATRGPLIVSFVAQTGLNYSNDIVQNCVKKSVKRALDGKTDASGKCICPCHDNDDDKITPVNIIIDPSGYVYEAVLSNRLEGVTATIYYKGGDGNPVFWVDQDGQLNPQPTDENGQYAWDVPIGNWLVTYEKAGYLSTDSRGDPAAQVNEYGVEGWSAGWLPVPPAQMEVNIGMVSLAAPMVTEVEAYPDCVVVTFSKYMDVDKLAGVFAVSQGGAVPITATAADAEEDPSVQGRMLARTFLLEGDFTVQDTLTLTVAGTAESYAGVAMGNAYNSGPIPVIPKWQVSAPVFEMLTADVGMSPLVLTCATENARIYYTLDGSDNWILYDRTVLYLFEDATLRAYAARPGWIDSAVVSEAYTAPEPIAFYRTPATAATTLAGIEITKQPNKISYIVGDALDLNGLGITATFLDGSVLPLSEGYTVFPANGAILASEGERTVTVSYTKDGLGKTASFTVTVSATAPVGTAPVITTATLPTGTVGTAYNQALAAIGTVPITWSLASGSLPGGLTLNAATGVISGTPTTSGTSDFTVKASNGIAPDATKTVSITINPTGGGGDGINIPPTPPATPPMVDIPDEGPPLAEWLEIVLPFEDVEDTDWFVDSIKYVYHKGLMTGTSLTPMLFSPSIATTRGMIVTILYRLEGSPDVSGLIIPFEDVEDGTWYTSAVIWAYHNDIVSGYGNGKYGPNDVITREQLAAVLNRYARFAGFTLPVEQEYTGFSDEADVSDYAKDSVKRFFEAGIINGKPGNVFDPKGDATRAELATMLMRFIELAEKN